MNFRRLVGVLVVALIGAVVLAGPALAAKVDAGEHGGRPLSTTATITVNPEQREVCWEITAQNITLPATAAHIHVGDVPTAPPNNVVVALTPPDAGDFSSGCAQVSRELAKAILKNPENYYVNVHTSDFQGGAIRGQLS